ncbi:MAG: hypothetical protein ABW061_12845 [Polyangiaceae bacterium]
MMVSPVKPLIFALVSALALTACHAQPKVDLKNPSRETFTSGMLAYLAARGDLCLGKEFPLDVTAREAQAGARNAVQMPVLEHLGLVSSAAAMGQVTTEDGPVAVPVTRYQLTASGRQYYLERKLAKQDGAHGDLCVAKLSLDRVVSWQVDAQGQGRTAVVNYTYHVHAAPWTQAPELKAVFPAVERVVAGDGHATLQEGFTLTDKGWLPNDVLTSDS